MPAERPAWIPPLDYQVLDVEIFASALRTEIEFRASRGVPYSAALNQVTEEARAYIKSIRDEVEEEEGGAE